MNGKRWTPWGALIYGASAGIMIYLFLWLCELGYAWMWNLQSEDIILERVLIGYQLGFVMATMWIAINGDDNLILSLILYKLPTNKIRK